MLGVGEHLLDRAGLDDPPRIHHRDPVAGLGEHAEVVGDQDQRQPQLLAQPLQQLQHLGLHDDVERRRRLVGDHQRRVARERERDHHPLSLAARELVGVAAAERPGQPDGRQQLVGALADFARVRRAGVQRDRLRELGVDPLHRVQRVHRALEDERDVAPAHEAHPRLGAALEIDRLVGPLEVQRHRSRLGEPAGQQLHQRQRRGRLAAPRLAGEPERLAVPEVEVDAVDDRLAVGEHVEVADFEEVRHLSSPPRALD